MAAAVAARSVLRSAAASARNATARLSSTVKHRAAPSPFRFSSQKSLSAPIFRSPVDTSGVSLGNRMVDCFSSCSKRFQRVQKKGIDLKRSTPSLGIVEGIDYDANRTSRLALVRWQGVPQPGKCDIVEEFTPPKERLESTTATSVCSPFAFSSLPGGSTSKDVFLSAFTSKGESASHSFDGSFCFPRIAVAGAKPAYFVFRKQEVGGKDTFSLGEIQKWRKDSILWSHRIKRKAAVSWHSFRPQGLDRASKRNESKRITKVKNGRGKVDRAPLNYIIASHKLRPGMMVMNWSKPSTSNTY